MKKWIWGSISGLIVLIVVGIGGWWLYDHFHYQQLVDQPADVKKWEADPRPLQSEQTAVKRIKEIPQSAQLGNRIAKGTKLVVIPGLRGAWSINAKTKRAGFGTNWVPQGVTQSKDSLFVSLYDGDHKLNSLILEINKKTGRYRKSFILKSKAHVGGITYDREKSGCYGQTTTPNSVAPGLVMPLNEHLMRIKLRLKKRLSIPHASHCTWLTGHRPSRFMITNLFSSSMARTPLIGRSLLYQ